MRAIRRNRIAQRERCRKTGASQRTQTIDRPHFPAIGTFPVTVGLACEARRPARAEQLRGDLMNGLIYLVGLIVVIMFILSLFGLR